MITATFHEKDIYPNSPYLEKTGSYFDRLTGKAVLFDDAGNVAMVVRTAHPYVLLPGGGIDEGETVEQGVIRECLEETGCVVELGEKIGVIDDFRMRDMKHCITYCYMAKVVGEKGTQILTEDEAAAGLHIEWMPFEKACQILEVQLQDLHDGKVQFYNSGFNMYRDLLFIQEARKLLE